MSARAVNIEYRYYHGFGLGYAFYKRYCVCNAIPLYAHKNNIGRNGCAGFHSILKTVHIKGFYGICVFVVIKAQSNAVFPESRQVLPLAIRVVSIPAFVRYAAIAPPVPPTPITRYFTVFKSFQKYNE